MSTKTDPGAHDCYAHALPDEPMFVLLARDPGAPALVEEWAHRREFLINSRRRPESDRAKVAEARECAARMRQWRAENDGAWRS